MLLFAIYTKQRRASRVCGQPKIQAGSGSMYIKLLWFAPRGPRGSLQHACTNRNA